MRIAVLDDYQRVAEQFGPWDRLAEHEVVFFHEPLGDDEHVVVGLADFDVVCAMRERTPFPGAVIERLPRLRLLVTTGYANAAIDLDAARAHGVTVSATRTSPQVTVEAAWALILALARRIPQEERALREGRWRPAVGTTLHGKTLGILGLGHLGGAVAQIGNALGMRVLAWSQNLSAERAGEVGAELVAKDELFAQADVLTIHLRLSDRTRGLVGEQELRLMKRTAMVVNTSRGPIVDEQALAAALQDGAIGGAALDVYDEEPLPLDHPLLRAPNTVMTPHIGYIADSNYEIFFADTVEDIEAFLAGTPIRLLT